ncbi:MAG: carbamoyltransferase HypF [Actinobacteria bacterium]|nr:carbamoyltransferase HypF [Actinomycetota bacterium]
MPAATSACHRGSAVTPPDRPKPPSPAARRVAFRVTGTVQGVGFRPTVHRHARHLGVAGWVANDASGVVGEVEGPPPAVDRLVHLLRHGAPPLAVVDRVEVVEVAPIGQPGFAVRPSLQSRTLAAALAIPADTATCAACLAEVADPADRRHRYAFTNCTACGPRLTIVTSPPYDRANTSMAAFPMCAACRAEYDDPADRRFHAEATCCPACGPRLRAEPAPADHPDAGPIDLVAADLRAGGVVAVKGLGGYHLAALAADEEAVQRVRAIKHRERKPMAVLVADLAGARRLAHVDAPAAALLAGPRAPIVLVPRRTDAPVDAAVADAVAPATHLLGLLLPPTALHHLLLAAVGAPIVLTSANPTDEPMVVDDDEARRRLAPHVDRLLAHDRAITTRVDDSVARIVDGAPTLLRRARGWAPEPIRLASPVPAPILAVGADLKSTVAVAVGDRAWLSTHLGDLAHPAARDAHAAAVDHLLALAGTAPEVVAHDLHPGYASTDLAADLAAAHGARLVGVQHHHAHLAACLVEHDHPGPVLGVAFDGLGHGTDGTAWGGELGLVDAHRFERLGHLAPVPMPGGDAAAIEPWRMAVAHLQACGRLDGADAVDGPIAALAALAARHADRWAAVAELARTGVRSPPTTSAGRLFDAVAALCGAGDENTYEGEAATALESLAASRPDAEPHPAGIDELDGHLVLRGGDLVAAAVDDLGSGVAPAEVAARFHAGLAALVAGALVRLGATNGVATVACSGGVLQNAVFATALAARLRAEGFAVLLHHRVPPNDGGIALGQVAVAAAHLRHP